MYDMIILILILITLMVMYFIIFKQNMEIYELKYEIDILIDEKENLKKEN